MWAGYTWKKMNSYIQIVIEEELIGKKSLGNPNLRWGDRIKNHVEN